ncbi:hypothetical protein IV203_014591 [Nitzschia inconspicua]|uniref:Uncharacterized protein n=1 Tax=Nitzschia inconspicua TaxID=303405 RepID=A0A9K3PUU9_9STRA|nr:hypothetical protein IV203_014591 [Nitzschia inconspicua]
MNQNKIAPMTKVALESIAGDLKNLVERLNAEKAPPVQINDVQHHLNDMNESIIQLTKAVVDLTNLLLGDAYTYRTIIESESVQVPVASREQHISGIVDQGSEVNSTVSLPTGLSVKSRSGNKDKVANMFKSRVVSTPSATPSRPSNVSSSDHHSTPLQHPPSTDQKLKRPPNSFKSPAKDLFNSKTTKTPSVKVAAKSSNLSKSKKMFTELARDAKLKEDQYFDILDVNHEDNDVADLL